MNKIFKKSIFGFSCLVILSSCSSNKNSIVTNMEINKRPILHFSPPKNWMNDPNGMFFYEGEYHLFYQYNPYGEKWGHMSWGHATSKDLITWNHLPVALEEENKVMIFSGSVVVDYNNTSGFGVNNQPPIIAIYTSYDANTGLQHQSIAYSTDKGLTFTKYNNNPVIDLNSKDFRDPKVFWYAEDNKWIMTVSMAQERKIRFYSSKNLKNWELLSDFGPTGATKGIWECPDLFKLKYKNESKWVLGVNLGNESISGGSGMQYFIGDFDGKKFRIDSNYSQNDINYTEYGKDYYAAVTWWGTPDNDEHKVWLGWMNNWQYAQDIPYYGWRSTMSIPRKLFLDKTNDKFYLRQEPYSSVSKYRKSNDSYTKKSISIINQTIKTKDLTDLTFEMDLTFEPSKINGNFFEFNMKTVENTVVKLSFDKTTNELIFVRTDAGNEKIKDFPSTQRVKIESDSLEIDIRIFVDKNSIEVFAENGKYVFTNLFYPTSKINTIEFNSEQNIDSSINTFKIYKY